MTRNFKGVSDSFESKGRKVASLVCFQNLEGLKAEILGCQISFGWSFKTRLHVSLRLLRSLDKASALETMFLISLEPRNFVLIFLAGRDSYSEANFWGISPRPGWISNSQEVSMNIEILLLSFRILVIIETSW